MRQTLGFMLLSFGMIVSICYPVGGLAFRDNIYFWGLPIGLLMIISGYFLIPDDKKQTACARATFKCRKTRAKCKDYVPKTTEQQTETMIDQERGAAAARSIGIAGTIGSLGSSLDDILQQQNVNRMHNEGDTKIEDGRLYVYCWNRPQGYHWMHVNDIKTTPEIEKEYISGMPKDLKSELERRAANEGLILPEYLRKHYYELIGLESKKPPESSKQKSRAQLMLEEIEK